MRKSPSPARRHRQLLAPHFGVARGGSLDRCQQRGGAPGGEWAGHIAGRHTARLGRWRRRERQRAGRCAGPRGHRPPTTGAHRVHVLELADRGVVAIPQAPVALPAPPGQRRDGSPAGSLLRRRAQPRDSARGVPRTDTDEMYIGTAGAGASGLSSRMAAARVGHVASRSGAMIRSCCRVLRSSPDAATAASTWRPVGLMVRRGQGRPAQVISLSALIHSVRLYVRQRRHQACRQQSS